MQSTICCCDCVAVWFYNIHHCTCERHFCLVPVSAVHYYYCWRNSVLNHRSFICLHTGDALQL